ncbi:glycosyltransferase family 39 protein [Phormidesmis sp. 146-33]
MTSPTAQNHSTSNKSSAGSWLDPLAALKVLLFVVVLLGVYFRFSYLGDRVYWHDEAHTLLRASGHTIAELTHTLFKGQVISSSQLYPFQQIQPDKSWIDTIISTATEDHPLTPLYYVLVHFWMSWFGNSLVAVRSLSVLLNLLAFPCLYWLSLELFGSRLAGWIAVGLFAISPLQVYYAPEVRAYSLWIVLVLLLHLALLRAMKQQTPQSWGLYAGAIALVLYTNLFSCLIMLGHGIYVICIERFRVNRRTIAYGVASAIGLLAFAPWLFALFTHLDQMRVATAWMNRSLPLPELAKAWANNLQQPFLAEGAIPGRLRGLALPGVIGLVGYAMFVLYRQTAPRTWWFITVMIIPPPLFLILQDLLAGGIRSTNSRYFLPCYLGIQLAIAYLISSHFSTERASLWKQRRWKLIVALLFTVGSLSCSIQVKKGNYSSYRPVADIINQFQQPLIVSHEISYGGGGTIGDILALNHLLKPEVKFQLVIDPVIPNIPKSFKTLLLYKPSPKFRQELGKTYKLQNLHADGLWRLNPR